MAKVPFEIPHTMYHHIWKDLYSFVGEDLRALMAQQREWNYQRCCQNTCRITPKETYKHSLYRNHHIFSDDITSCQPNHLRKCPGATNILVVFHYVQWKISTGIEISRHNIGIMHKLSHVIHYSSVGYYVSSLILATSYFKLLHGQDGWNMEMHVLNSSFPDPLFIHSVYTPVAA